MNIKDLSIKYFTSNGCLNSYLADIRKYKVMTVEEEEQAFEDYKNGSKVAREKIINSNQRFVFALAKRYAKTEEEVLDYVNEGNIGLITALENFESDKGFKFITYAVWYIQRSMNYYFTVTNNIIKRSNSMKIGKKAEHAREKLYASTGVMPTDEEVAEMLKNEYGIKVSDNSDIAVMNVESINGEIKEDYSVEDCSEFNIATANENLAVINEEKEFMKTKIDKLMRFIENLGLSDKFRKVVYMSFGIGYEEPCSDEAISESLDICVEEVAKRRKLILAYIKQEFGEEKIAV